MSLDEAIKAYTDRFGEFPYFLVMGMPETDLIREIERALRVGEPIKPVEGRIY